MDATPLSLPTIEHLREHVVQVLCAHDRLDPQQTPLHEAVITRSGKVIDTADYFKMKIWRLPDGDRIIIAKKKGKKWEVDIPCWRCKEDRQPCPFENLSLTIDGPDEWCLVAGK